MDDEWVSQRVQRMNRAGGGAGGPGAARRRRRRMLPTVVVAAAVLSVVVVAWSSTTRSQAAAKSDGAGPKVAAAEPDEGAVEVERVELPSAVEGLEAPVVEVAVAAPPESLGDGSFVSGGVDLFEVPTDARRAFVGSPVEGHDLVVDEPTEAGLWLVARGESLFVAWGEADPDPGVRAGDRVGVVGLVRVVADADGHLVAAGVEAGALYVHALRVER